MSRIRRLKENRRKNTIKTTVASLALVLALGFTQVIGTYALFTDTVDLPSNLSISTGDVDVRVDDGFNITIEDDYYIKDNEQIQKKHKFNIYNDGTLKQNISLSLDYNSNMNIDGYISYDLKFDN
ncbi:TasA family protein, partial [Paraclostridium sordellii]|uniref:TasA family protein n=3 Tax=Paraclostridium sordellii TaxID=1505 RepID=UPI000A42AC21